MTECECLAPILIVSQLPIQLVTIVQSYLHSKIPESFYEEAYKNFKLCVRLDGKRDMVEDIKLFPPPVNIPLSSHTKDLLVLINEDGFDHTIDGPDTLFYMQYMYKKVSCNYFIRLTLKTILCDNCPDVKKKYSYRTMHKNLIKYFSEGNMHVLLAEMEQQNHITFIKEDFERIWFVLNSKIVAWMKDINFYQEIHR